MNTHLNWPENETTQTALWVSESGTNPPKHMTLADDTLSAENAHRLASEGHALLWRGDFQNARHLLQALTRRLDKLKSKKTNKNKIIQSNLEVFHQHRMAQAQRAHILNAIVIVVEKNHHIDLRRAPDVVDACFEVLGEQTERYALPLRQLLAYVSAHEWRKNGVLIPALNSNIHPHYGVFSPIRGEYLELINSAPLPKPCDTAWDIGTGTGVISAVLARRGVKTIIATDTDPRALACARDNFERLGLTTQVQLHQADLFPQTNTKADLIVCNPPWLPAKAAAPIERAIFDEKSQMLKGFLLGVGAHLSAHGQAWLIMSDFAEHLGLRAPNEIPDMIERAGLRVLKKHDIRPQHGKVFDKTDPLHAARALETTSLWCLTLAAKTTLT
ncbi:MAG: methylase of polypeptide chain release factor [Burkholderiaceae bacterium]|nr:methylase of polypeptide chain release factor [Burkholderiaceae bacterium]